MPFDSQRSGMMLGEGGAVLVLEDREHAVARNAPIYAEIAGYGTCVTPVPEEAGNVDGAAHSMKAALEQAGIAPSAVDAVFAGANGSKSGDRIEALALHKIFGDQVPSTTAVKSMVGESYSAAGAIQSAAAVLALSQQTMPGTIHFSQPDSSCPVYSIVRSTQPKLMSSVMVNTFGSAGNFASVVLKTYEN
jgi:3-oxoacyl-[acyl-carrier-protein] synthase II